MVIFGTFGTVDTFGTPVAFGTLRKDRYTMHYSYRVLVHLVHFGSLDVWYTDWYTRPTPVGTRSGFFGTLGSCLFAKQIALK